MAFLVLPLLFNVCKNYLCNGSFSGREILQIFFVAVFLLQSPLNQAAHCNEDQFMCKDGTCIIQTKICDGRLDCSDNSDEIDCDLKMCRKPNWYQCPLLLGPCLSSDLICNGIENCPGGEDELDCVDGVQGFSKDLGTGGWHSVKRNCSRYEFTCKSDRLCIPKNFMCDGKKDCHDGSDETIGCIKAITECKGYFCQNKRCLESKKFLCDGIDDCGDGSDEKDCVGKCTAEMGKFLCHNNITCLPLQKACNGVADCPDYTDESTRCTSLKDCKNKKCPPAAKCQMMPYSDPKCICPKGFRHSLTSNLCVDIDECLEQYGACSQTCINSPGTYRCTCDEGYTLMEDKRTCKANGEEALLLYTTQVTVMGINLRSKRVYTVAKNLSKVIGVSYNGEHIYWTNIQNEEESIVKANLDGTQQEILLTSGLDAPEDLAVDWLTGNIYFSDNVMHHIAVCSNDGQYCTAIVTDDVHQPRGVALWPKRSQIFWSDWGENPKIARASMDGTNSMHLVTEKIHWPNGIALDMYNERIYWVDAKLSTIESVRTDGTDRRIVLEEILKHPYGLAIFEDNIYWSDWGTKSIHTCNKFTGKGHKIITKDRNIYAVHIYHSSKQKKTTHACEKARCSHLCLLAEQNSYSCACPDGMQLGPDQLRCLQTHKKQRLFLGVQNNLLEMEHTKFGRHSIMKTHRLNLFIHEMAFNNVNNTIFLADNYQRTITELDLNANTLKTLVNGTLGNISALAFDHLSYNLYWTDSKRHAVEVLSLQTKQRAMVSFFSGLETPIGLAIVPKDGSMLVALKSRHHVHIDKISLNGRGEHTHVFEEDLGDNDIKFSSYYYTNTIYWTDSDLGKISYSDYHYLYAHVFRESLRKPYSIAIVDEDIFWSELKSNTIHWTHINNLGPIKRFDIEVDHKHYPFHSLPTHISLVASSPNVKSDHPCQHLNGGCSHVCVSLGKFTYDCLCPVGYVFKDTANHTCIEALDCEFRCRTGECLTFSHKCNGHKDCPDNSDEDDCQEENKQKSKVICPVGKFMCHNQEQCLEAEERCDGKLQCHDGSDEEHCEKFDKSKHCHKHQHVCDNGNCVDFSVMCDGTNDCGDNSDEFNCQFAGAQNDSLLPVCQKDMFQCNSGTCIPKSWECDGEIDCADSTDEHDKCGIKECPSDMHRCFLELCIDKSLVCDGHNDCGDLSDEQNCDMATAEKQKTSCGDNLNQMYQCASDPNICLELTAKCNGKAECPLGEDEIDCGNLCSIHEFECKSGIECIRKEFRCDQEEDCADGSDEDECDRRDAWNSSVGIYSHEKACGPKMWDCRDGECVEESRVCDGTKDCSTGADEGPLCKTACRLYNGRAPCQHKCKSTPAGGVCSCLSGYKLHSDHRSCKDINECEKFDACPQICENSHGSFRCSCYADFMLGSDKITCKSIESEKSLLFSTYNEVHSMTEQPLMLKVAWKANDTKINGFDLNVRTRSAYFTTDNVNILYKIDMETAKVKSALAVQMPSKVAVDWITDNVYVISRSQIYEIQVCSFSAKMCGTILKAQPHEIIKTLTVDAYNRRLFFVILKTQSFGAHNSLIVTSNLDGSKREHLISKEMSFITTLACDPYKKMLYYTDLHQKTLEAISYRAGSKTHANTLIQKSNAVMLPSGLTWYENQVYIVNLGSRESMRCDVYGSLKCKVFNLNVLNAEDILIDGVTRQPMRRNPCHMAKCRGMCVQTELNYVCMCGNAIVSETQHCDINNEITFSALLLHEAQLHKAKESSHTSLAVWSMITTFTLLLCVMGYFYYRRNKQQDERDFIRNMHFQNPLASIIPQQCSSTANLDNELTTTASGNSGTTAATFEADTEELHIGSTIQNFFRGSTSAHGSEILLQTAKPSEVPEMDTVYQRQQSSESHNRNYSANQKEVSTEINRYFNISITLIEVFVITKNEKLRLTLTNRH